jgi:hypothetical protein
MGSSTSKRRRRISTLNQVNQNFKYVKTNGKKKMETLLKNNGRSYSSGGEYNTTDLRFNQFESHRGSLRPDHIGQGHAD